MPGNTCKICQHPKRKEIDRAIVGGESTRTIAKLYGPSNASVYRHSLHLPKQLAKAVVVKEEIYLGSVIDQLHALYRETAEDREALRERGNYELALRHASVMTKMLELRGKILGELKDGGTAVTMNGPITVTVQYESKTLAIQPQIEAPKQPFIDA